MSCYEWERATIKFSVAEFPKFKEKFINGYNDAIKKDLETVSKVFEIAMQSYKQKTIVKSEIKGKMSSLFMTPAYALAVIEEYAILHALFTKKGPVQSNGRIPLENRDIPIKPKASMAPFLKKTGPILVNYEDLQISLDAKERTLNWGVSENNHAVDRAKDSYVGKLTFKLLSGVNWTRGTGGIFYGDNEYHRENERGYPEGGGHLISARFGPLGKKKF